MLTVDLLVDGQAAERITHVSSLVWVDEPSALGSWSLRVPADSLDWGLIDGDAPESVGILVSDQATGETWSGACDQPSRILGVNGRELLLTGWSHNAILECSVVLPTPASPTPSPLYADEVWALEADGVTAVASMIDAQMGQSAHASRRFPGLTVVGEGSAPSTTVRARMGSCLSVAASYGLPLGVSVRTVCDGSGGYVSTVRSGGERPEVVFNPERAGSSSETIAAATATAIVVGGTGEGTSREFVAVEGARAAGQWRRERFVSETQFPDGATQGERLTLMSARAADELAVSGASRAVSMSLAEQGENRYGRDYRAGDWVTVRTGGRDYRERIASVTSSMTDAGEVVREIRTGSGPLVGEMSARDAEAWRARLDALEAK